VDRALGAEIWDVDGNKYIDLVSALASITLGYGDKKVSKAVIIQKCVYVKIMTLKTALYM
jgi:glutamate-1-semialdehyde 2,1-aminomutase